MKNKIINLSSLSKETQALIKAEIKKVRSSLPGAYSQSKGDFQREYNRIWNDFIPAIGNPKNTEAKLVLAASSLYNDYFNNGWGNNRLDEIKLLMANDHKFGSFYKGSNLSGLLSLILDIQEAQVNPEENPDNPFVIYDEDEDDGSYIDFDVDHKEIERVSEKSIEPYLDNLMDAVVQYAYSILYLKQSKEV